MLCKIRFHYRRTLNLADFLSRVGRWYGRMSFSGSLAPGETTSCTASLVFNQPGLCQTGDWYLEVHEMGDAHQWSLQGESRIVAVQPYSGH